MYLLLVTAIALVLTCCPASEANEPEKKISTGEACARIIADLEAIRLKLNSGVQDWNAVCANYGFSDDNRCLREIPRQDRLKAPVIKLNLSATTRTGLLRGQLQTIAQVVTAPTETLLELVGEHGVAEVTQQLIKYEVVSPGD